MTSARSPARLPCSPGLHRTSSSLDFSRCGVIVDPWAGTRVVAEEFAKNGHAVISNDLSGAHGCELQEDALQPAFYRGVAQKHGRIDAFVI